MQHIINKLVERTEIIGLKINKEKAKLMRINNTSPAPIYVQGVPIGEVSEFEYLGSTITTDGGTAKDIKHRIAKARCAFSRLWTTLKSTQIARGTKIRIFNACVKSVLLYGKYSDDKTRTNRDTNKKEKMEMDWPHSKTPNNIDCTSSSGMGAPRSKKCGKTKRDLEKKCAQRNRTNRQNMDTNKEIDTEQR
ncbi:uncharacterized protein LOC129605682 [Condylostylus longicornis]|uniref:uncharacterized protein LOC129605682 n=1 Tax=Condylostylus longicornis TaxID=2530218 RepID=UPI00244DEAEF|nr:uncharacterized protein LOC129605682 [Condylostylus longicornis]